MNKLTLNESTMITRMHSSRMCTACSSSHLEGVSTRHPLDQTPLSRHPLEPDIPQDQKPLGPGTTLDQAPPGPGPPEQAPVGPGTLTPRAGITMPPLGPSTPPVDRHTPVNIERVLKERVTPPQVGSGSSNPNYRFLPNFNFLWYSTFYTNVDYLPSLFHCILVVGGST